MARFAARLAVVLAAGLPLSALATVPPPAGAAGPGSRSCAWQFELAPNRVNALYPDAAARYWFTLLPAVPGERLRIAGRFPHARYISFNTYDGALHSVNDLADVHIVPDRGSGNPFLPGANRRMTHRAYRVLVVFGRQPRHPPPNTLYTTSSNGRQGARMFVVAYRVYRADRGLDGAGGVGVPSVTVLPPAGQPYRVPRCEYDALPGQGALNQALARSSLPWPHLAPLTGLNPPRWHKFVNAETSAAHVALENGYTGSRLSGPVARFTASHFPPGGFANDQDNAYIYTQLSSYYGAAAVIRGKLPSFPHTYLGEPVMGTGQLRYWSICSEDTQTQRMYGCLVDDRMVTDGAGDYTIVVSSAAHRPAGPLRRCGIDYLTAGPMFDTVLIVRNMLPAPGFRHSIQRARPGRLRSDLGAYFPRIRYVSAARLAALGCR